MVRLPAALTAIAVLGLSAATSCRSAPTTVEVDLTEWAIQPTAAEVKAGRLQFVAHNRSTTLVHELELLAVGSDGQLRPVGEIEDIAPTASKSFTKDVPVGSYLLACLIAEGEAGSPVDHYKAGMHTPLTVR